MEKSEKKDLNERVKNKKYTKNSSSDEINNDLSDKEEEKIQIIADETDDNNQQESKEETNSDEKLLNEITALKEEKLRLLAEMENLRKRFEREKIESMKFGSIHLVRELLSPGDNLERALAAIPKDEKLSQSIRNLVEGLKMVQKEFRTILEKNGVKKIDSLNKKFDHNYHQAMMEIEKEDVDEGTVVQEIQSGYIMHDRLLRPAMVSVSKKSFSDNSKKNNGKTDNKEKIKSEENQEK